jgi:hypothetical protein
MTVSSELVKAAALSDWVYARDPGNPQASGASGDQPISLVDAGGFVDAFQGSGSQLDTIRESLTAQGLTYSSAIGLHSAHEQCFIANSVKTDIQMAAGIHDRGIYGRGI